MPLRPLGRPLAASKALRFLFQTIWGTPGHHFGHCWESFGSPGCPIGHVLRAHMLPKERKVDTVFEAEVSRVQALEKTRLNLFNVTKT